MWTIGWKFPDVLGDRSPAIFADVLSGAFQMFSSVFQSTWRDNSTQSALGCDYASCFSNVAFFNPLKESLSKWVS